MYVYVCIYVGMYDMYGMASTRFAKVRLRQSQL
jgi:hypothetical protein